MQMNNDLINVRLFTRCLMCNDERKLD